MSRLWDAGEMLRVNGQLVNVGRNHNLDMTGGQARMAAVERRMAAVGNDGATADGTSLDPVWHGLGKRLGNVATAAEMWVAAGLNFKIEKWPLLAKFPGTDIEVPVPNRFATVRSDSKAVLGVVSESYKILQNDEAFQFMDAVVASGDAIYDTAGSLFGGAQMWVLARIPEVLRAGAGDEVLPYALLVNGHDGKTAIKFLPTTVRVVCNNTKNLALNTANGRDLTIYHQANLAKQVAAARLTLGVIRERVTQHQEEINLLVASALTDAGARAYFEKVFPAPVAKTQEQLNEEIKRTLVKHKAGVGMENAALLDNILEFEASQRAVVTELLAGFNKQQERAEKRHAALLETLVEIYHEEQNQVPGARDTLWGAYNTVTQYADHCRHHNGEGEAQQSNRLQSAWFGSGEEMKEKALALALSA